MNHALVVFLMTASLVAAGSNASQDGGTNKKVIEMDAHDLHVTPSEKTVGERLHAADAVLLVRIIGGGRSRVVDLNVDIMKEHPEVAREPVPIVLTEYEIQVLEVIKEHPLASGGLPRIGEHGGNATWREFEIVSRRCVPDLLVPQATYLVFLRYVEAVGDDDGRRLRRISARWRAGSSEPLGDYDCVWKKTRRPDTGRSDEHCPGSGRGQVILGRLGSWEVFG